MLPHSFPLIWKAGSLCVGVCPCLLMPKNHRSHIKSGCAIRSRNHTIYFCCCIYNDCSLLPADTLVLLVPSATQAASSNVSDLGAHVSCGQEASAPAAQSFSAFRNGAKLSEYVCHILRIISN